MIKQILVLITLFYTLIAFPVFAEVTSKVTKKSDSGNILELTYYDGDKEVAKRFFEDKKYKLGEQNGDLKGTIPDGVVKRYYDNGKIETETSYKNNKREGLNRFYYDNGSLKSEIFFKNDQPEGILKAYYENGHLQAEMPADKNGVRDGVFAEYNEDGSIKSKITYKNNKIVYNLCTILYLFKAIPGVMINLLVVLLGSILSIIALIHISYARVGKAPYSNKDETLKLLTEALAKEGYEFYKQKKDVFQFKRTASNKFLATILPGIYKIIVKFKQKSVVIMGSPPTRIRHLKNLVFASNLGYPGFWKRYSALFYDYCLLLFVVYGIPQFFASKSFFLEHSVFILISFCVLSWLYFSLFESSSMQATPGKYFLGLKVSETNGDSISFERATARFWLKIISTLPFFIGFILVGITKKKRALHDILSGCIVYYG